MIEATINGKIKKNFATWDNARTWAKKSIEPLKMEFKDKDNKLHTYENESSQIKQGFVEHIKLNNCFFAKRVKNDYIIYYYGFINNRFYVFAFGKYINYNDNLYFKDLPNGWIGLMAEAKRIFSLKKNIKAHEEILKHYNERKKNV